MPYTRATRWRQRDNAIAKKAGHEVDPWEELDENVSMQTSQPLKLTTTQPPSSPISVATTFDSVPDVEIKPLLLPGAWVVVGKRGKPKLQDEMKMYEEPTVMAASKKKKTKKAKKAPVTEGDPLVVVLAEASSSTSCIRAFERSSAQRDKLAHRAKDARYWASYQRAKLRKREALHELVATLTDDVRTDDQMEVAAPAPPPGRPSKDHKANSNKDKARRRARSAAAAARCFVHDQDDSAPLAAEYVASEAAVRPARQPSDEITLLPDAWRTVGKKGKVLSEFPPLASTAKPSANKPKASSHAAHQPNGQSGKQVSAAKAKGYEPNEAPPSKSIKLSKGRGTCSVM